MSWHDDFLGPLACIVDSLPKMGSRQKSPSGFNEALHVVTTDAGIMLKYQWYQTCHLLRVILRPSRSGWQLLFERSCKTEETAMYLGHWQSGFRGFIDETATLISDLCFSRNLPTAFSFRCLHIQVSIFLGWPSIPSSFCLLRTHAFCG